MFAGMLVSTPYGQGEIVELRKTDDSLIHCIVSPTSWLMTGGQKPTFYLNIKDAKPLYGVDQNVSTVYGSGTVTEIREADQIFVVRLESWKLADGKSPTLFLNQSALSLPALRDEAAIEKQKQSEKFDAVLAKALAAKNDATAAFKKSDMMTARSHYLLALETMQQVYGDLTNEQKAKLFEQTVTCNNNVALCCMRTNNMSDCVAFAKNALILINSLETKIPDGEIWKCLSSTGITLDKLQKEWKKKALYFVGKAELKRQNYQAALDSLGLALQLIDKDPKLAANAQELRDLIDGAQKRRSKEKQREKQTWSKAFQKNKTVKEDEHSTSGVSSGATSPTPNGHGEVKVETIGADLSAVDFSKIKVDLGLNSLSGLASKDKKKNQSSDKSGQQQALWQPDAAGYGTMLMGLGILGLVGGAAYWWLRLRKDR